LNADNVRPSVTTGAVPQPKLEAMYGRLPISFEENRGQSDARVRYVARGAGYSFFITNDETVAVLHKHDRATARRGLEPIESIDNGPAAVLRMSLNGANEQPIVRGEELLPGKSNYFIGNDRSKWRTNVPQYERVRISEAYRGIDIVYYGNQRQLEYDLVVAGADRARSDCTSRARNGSSSTGRAISCSTSTAASCGSVFQPCTRSTAAYGIAYAAYRRLSAREFGVDLDPYDATSPWSLIRCSFTQRTRRQH
jgi:hypothetical protein